MNLKIKITKKSNSNQCWYNKHLNQAFTVKEQPNFSGVHKNSVIVRTPCNHDGWVWAGDYEFVNDYD